MFVFKAAVVGAGTMGAEIAQLIASAGIPVVLHDVAQPLVDAGLALSLIHISVRKGDRWVISGSKCFITNGSYANFYTVYAKTDPDAGHRGISCFVVPRDAGVIVDGHEDKMGQRASNTATTVSYTHLSSFLSTTTPQSRSTTNAEMPRWPASLSVFA